MRETKKPPRLLQQSEAAQGSIMVQIPLCILSLLPPDRQRKRGNADVEEES